MKLTTDQSYALLEKFGVYAKECCDRCGRIIGPVSFTRAGDSGVWCSRECQGDGERRSARRGGRPCKYVSEEQRRTAKTRLQRDYRLRPGVEKTPSNVFGNKGLTGAKNASLVVAATEANFAPENAPNAKVLEAILS